MIAAPTVASVAWSVAAPVIWRLLAVILPVWLVGGLIVLSGVALEPHPDRDPADTIQSPD